ncbi:MAG: MFS transporter [Halieaceae bacterium]|nr:MFS transporter [Halieaceae bacterium]
MGGGQYLAILICIVLAAFDGFDILAIALAAPGIAAQWQLSQSLLGWVMTMELIGIAFGAAFIGNLADRIGRRPVILSSILLISAGMFATAISPNVYVLSLSRVVTGIGIGAVMAALNAVVAEVSNGRNRSTFILLMTAGYGAGAIAGGMISAELLRHFDWRSLFYFGATGTVLVFPLAYPFLYESVSFLEQKQPDGAQEKIRKILVRYGHEPNFVLPDKVAQGSKAGFALLFSTKYRRITALLSFAFLAHISTYYFVMKWIPKLVVDSGFTASEGATVLVWASFGTLAGGLSMAVIARFFDPRRLVITMMVAAAVFVVIFGRLSADLTLLTIASVIAGFFTYAAAIGQYPLIASYFPTEIRAGGTGVVLAIGRGGAVAGPVIAGYLLQANIPLAQVAMLISLGSLSAALSIWLLGSSSSSSGGR